MTPRDGLARNFLAGCGWGDAHRALLAGDASNRRYDRLERTDGTRAVLMDADPAKGEDVRPFISIATYLAGLGLSAPEILGSDEENGFLLLEDLGDALFARVMAADPALQRPLYAAAVDVLTQLHAATPPDLERYDAARTVPLAALAFDWYLSGATGSDGKDRRQAFIDRFARILAPLDAKPQVLIQRDFHAENLLWLPEREGAARVGLLDFQDAMLGHPAYDLVSILQDARRDVGKDMEAEMVDRFLTRANHDPADFRAAYAVLGLQRNLRILGVFARLCMRDGKRHYVDLIPRVWGHVRTNLAHPALADVAGIIDEALPPPTPEILDRLKAQCATHRSR